MTSTFSTNKGLEEPASGDYVNAWATPVNANWTAIDAALGGTTQISVTGISAPTTTLTLTQYRPPNIEFTGTLGANLNYQIPTGVGGLWSVSNATTGAFTLSFSIAAGNALVLGSGRTAVISNGVVVTQTNSMQIITTALLAPFLNLGLSAVEILANVAPTNLSFPVLHPMRYGALGDGITDDSAALATWVSVVNAQPGQTATWSSPRGTYISGPMPLITSSDFTLQANGSVIKVKADSWGTTGDGSTHLQLTGNGARIYDLVIDGNQLNFTAPPIGRLIQWVNQTRLVNCSFKNSPHQGARSGGIRCQIVNCHFDSNANLGFEGDVISYVTFVACTFDFNGYGYQKTFATNTFAAISFILRYRSHHVTLIGCQALQNGRDGMCVNQGSYAVKFIGCLAWMNNDGGFTIAADNTGTGAPGESESPYDIEYVDCEAYNNDTSGLACYCAGYNVTVDGGRYYNNNRIAGLLSQTSSFVNGLYFAAGSTGIVIRTKAYDDRQLSGVISVSGSGSTRTLTCSNWTPGTFQNYPQVALYNSSYVFQGYGTITAESTNSVTISSTAFNGVLIASIGSSWIVTQRVQHNGIFIDTGGALGCIATVEMDGFGFLSGPQPYMGFEVISGLSANQNIWRPDLTLDYTELLANPTFDTNLTGWTFTAPAGSSSSRITSGNVRSPGALQLVGGTSVVTNGDSSAGMISGYLNYISSGVWIETAIWSYSIPAGGAIFEVVYNPGSGNIVSALNHPGGGWKLLKIGMYIPAGTTSLFLQVIAAVGITVSFDSAYLRTKMDGTDGRDFSYPTRNLPV